MSIEEYWKNFLIKNNLPQDTKYFDAFCFYGYSDEITIKLTDLVLAGKKKATTSAFLEEDNYPKIGSYSIILDINGNPVGIIQTRKTRILRLKDMTWDLACKEGEGDSLDGWLFDHNLVFEQEAKQLGYKFSIDMPIFFEEFELVYKG